MTAGSRWPAAAFATEDAGNEFADHVLPIVGRRGAAEKDEFYRSEMIFQPISPAWARRVSSGSTATGSLTRTAAADRSMNRCRRSSFEAPHHRPARLQPGLDADDLALAEGRRAPGPARETPALPGGHGGDQAGDAEPRAMGPVTKLLVAVTRRRDRRPGWLFTSRRPPRR